MPKSSPLIIFDCDGVLIDSEALAAPIEVAELRSIGCRIELEEYLDRALGRTEEAEVWGEIAAEYGVRLPEGFVEALWDKVARAFEERLETIPGVEEALDRIPYEKCVASGSRPDRLRKNLERAGLTSFFEDRVFSATEAPRGKPFPDLFQLVARRLNRDVADCLVIEDSLAGVQAARAAGMRVIGFAGASHCRPGWKKRLRREGASPVLERMKPLPELCRKIFRSERGGS